MIRPFAFTLVKHNANPLMYYPFRFFQRLPSDSGRQQLRLRYAERKYTGLLRYAI